MASNGGGDESDDSYDPQLEGEEEEEDDGDEHFDEGSPEDLMLRIDEAIAPGEALLNQMMGPLRHSLAEQERLWEGRVVAQLMSEDEEEEEEEEERGGGEVEVSEVGSSEGRRMRMEDETAVWEYEADCSVCMEPWTEEGRHQSWYVEISMKFDIFVCKDSILRCL